MIFIGRCVDFKEPGLNCTESLHQILVHILVNLYIFSLNAWKLLSLQYR